MDCGWVKIRWVGEELGDVAWRCMYVGKVRAELRWRQGKRLYRGHVVDNSNECGKHQVFTECENMCSTIALWRS